MLRHRLSQLAVVPMLFLVLTGCSGSNCEPSQDIQSDSTEDAADTIDCPDGLVFWPEYDVCAPRVDECEAWEVPVIGGGCMAVGPRGCPKLWDPDADVDCQPGELLPCPEGFVETEDGVACVPVPPDLFLDMPYFDECPPGHLALEGGGCVQVGPRACPKLWDPDADVDCEIGDILPCPDGWVESEDGMYCHPGWDECGHGEVPLVGGGCERVIPLPEDCPAGPFPEVPDGAADVLYVLAEYPCTEGCGAEAAPYPSIQTAIDAAPSGAAVLVGPGTYAEGLTLTKPVHIAGLCASLVEVTGKALVLPDGDSKVLEAGVGIFDVQGVTLSGLRVRSPAAGVAIVGAIDVVLEGLDIVESHGVALYIDGWSDVDADDLWIHDTEPGSGQMGHGRGVWVGGGASLEAHSVLVEAARKTGIEVREEGTRLDLTDGVIRKTVPDGNGKFGKGIQATNGCTVSLSGSLLEENRLGGLDVYHSGTEVEVSGSVIRKTLPNENGEEGWGIIAEQGCRLILAGSLLEENRYVGLAVLGSGTEAEVSGSVIHKTLPDEHGELGIGIHASEASAVSMAGSLLEENRECGLVVYDTGTEVEVSGSAIRKTMPDQIGESGIGIQAAKGCTVSVIGSLLEENRECGLVVYDTGTEVEVSGSVIRKTLSDENGEFGKGIQASHGCRVSVAGSLLEENREIGLAVFYSGTAVEVSGSVIRKTLPDGNGEFGRGINASDGCTVSVVGSLLEENRNAGLLVGHSGTEVEVSGSVIRKTVQDEYGKSGAGISAGKGCRVSVAGSLLEENRAVGLQVVDSGTEIEVSGSVIRKTMPDGNGEYGFGIGAAEGCTVSVIGSLLEENRETGLAVFDSGTEVEVSGSVIRKTMQDGNGEFGLGVSASGGSMVLLAGNLLDENRAVGLAGFQSGTEVGVFGSVIRKTMPDNDGMHGEGLFVQEGASGTASWCRIEGNSTSGISVWGWSEGPGRRDPSLLHVENSAVLNTKKGGGEFPGGGYEVFGDGVFAGGGSELQLDSVVVMDNARAGAYYHESAGGMSNTVIAGNGSYGLAMESCHQYVDYSDAFIFGNVLEAVTTSPQGLPVPPPPEFDMEPLSPPRDLDE